MDLENKLMKDLKLRGIPEISKVYIQEAKVKAFNQETGAFNDKQTEWELLTDGTNLNEIFLVDNVDFRRITSNDINQIYESLGVEAVRNTLIQELRKVLGHYGIYVNYRHLAILCDVMTQNGQLTSITRHGINRGEQGPLRKSSFEETVEILLEAGVFAEVDHLKGITENIMLGQLAPYGTGCFDLLLDTDMILKADFIDNPEDINIYDFVDNKNEMSTPDINYIDNNMSPSRTPFGMKTPNVGFNSTSTPLTNYRASPLFTPGIGNRTPNIIGFNNFNSDCDPVVNITSPYPYMRGQNPTSPGYNPSEYAKSPVNFEFSGENSKYNSSHNVSYSPRQSMMTKSPCLNQPYSNFQSVNSPYSPSSPIVNPGKPTSSYGVSPSYQLSNNVAYSPKTPIYRNLGTSPEYSKGNFYSVRSSSYSLVNSPKLNYSPNSPTYNPKSPAYNAYPSKNTIFYLFFKLFIYLYYFLIVIF